MVPAIVIAAFVATGVAVVRRLGRSGPPTQTYTDAEHDSIRASMVGRSHTHGHY